VSLPNGVQTELELVRHPGGAAVVALDDQDRICLLRQYRHIASDWLWELPAGKLEPGEPPVETARRELAEEAGIQAQQWRSLGRTWSSPGVFGETIHLWLATQLSGTAHKHEPDELLEVHWLPWARAWEMAQDGRITDAKTLAGLLRAQSLVAQAGSGTIED
jgi:ADP-ribose pyrophosphatase